MSQRINLNTTPNQFMPILYFSQGDIGRTFEIALTSSDGYSIPIGATVEMVATKPSGFGFTVSGSLTGNVATFVTTETMTSEWGRFPAEIVIKNNGDVIGTANFYLNGERNPHPEGTIDGDASTIIPQLTLLVERVETAASSVLDRQTVTQTLPAGSQASYSFDEETNTQTFGIPQGEAGAGAVDVTASAYSSSKTYAVGDYVIHNDYLYRCTTAITTAEAWTSGHWTQVLLGDEVSDLKSALDNIDRIIPFKFESGTFSGSVGQVPTKTAAMTRARCYSFIPVTEFSKISVGSPYHMWVGCLNSDKEIMSESYGWITSILSDELPAQAQYITVVIRDSTNDSHDLRNEIGTISQLFDVTLFSANDVSVIENLIDNSMSVNDLKSAPYNNSTATLWVSTSVNSKWNGEPRFAMSGAKYIRVDFPTLEKGKRYTFSCDITRTENSTQDGYITIGNITKLYSAPKDAWNRASFSFIADDNTIFAKVGINQPSDGWVGSAKMFMLNKGSEIAWMMSANDIALQEELNILGIHTFTTKGQLNVIKRARQITDIKWTPVADLVRISKQGDDSRSIDGLWFEDKFESDKQYTGCPYSETNHVQDYGYIRKAHIGETIGFETFLTSVRNAKSALMVESQYRQLEHSATLYGEVCTSLVCYAIGQRNANTSLITYMSGLISKGVLSTVGADTIDICDILLYSGFHIAIITDVIKDDNNKIAYLEISEATVVGNDNNVIKGGELGGICRRKWWDVASFMKAWGVYTVYRYENTSDVVYKPSEAVPMLNEGNYRLPLTMACMPYMGNKFIYIKGSIPSTKVLISSIGYNTLVIKKDGESWQTFPVTNSTESVDVGFNEEGTYEAYLANVFGGAESTRTLSCYWRVSTASISITVSGGTASFVCDMPDDFDTPIAAILKGNTDDLYPWYNLTSVTKEEIGGGAIRYSFSIPVPANANGYGRVAFENEFGCWHSQFVAY